MVQKAQRDWHLLWKKRSRKALQSLLAEQSSLRSLLPPPPGLIQGPTRARLQFQSFVGQCQAAGRQAQPTEQPLVRWTCSWQTVVVELRLPLAPYWHQTYPCGAYSCSHSPRQGSPRSRFLCLQKPLGYFLALFPHSLRHQQGFH